MQDSLHKQENIPTEIDLIIRSAQVLKEIETRQAVQEKRLSILESKSDQNSGDIGYLTILAWCNLKNIPYDVIVSRKKGREASIFSRENRIEIRKVDDVRYGKVNSYRKDVLENVFAKVMK